MQISPLISSTSVQLPIKAKHSIKKHQPLVFNSLPKTKMKLTLHPTKEDPARLRLHIRVFSGDRKIFSQYTESTVSSPGECPELFDEVSRFLLEAQISAFYDEDILRELRQVKQIGDAGDTARKSKSSKWFSGFSRF